jgi:hypothetical protein
MNTNNSSKNGGVGFCGLLTIVFIVLKLTHYIDWSWWWVLSPLSIPVAIFLIVVFAIILSKVISRRISKPEQEIKKVGFAGRIQKLQDDRERMRMNK